MNCSWSHALIFEFFFTFRTMILGMGDPDIEHDNPSRSGSVGSVIGSSFAGLLIVALGITFAAWLRRRRAYVRLDGYTPYNDDDDDDVNDAQLPSSSEPYVEPFQNAKLQFVPHQNERQHIKLPNSQYQTFPLPPPYEDACWPARDDW